MALSFEIVGRFNRARAAQLTLPHFMCQTPRFMPVGTQGTIKGLTNNQLEEIGCQIILGNTYHLALHPGTEVLGDVGGLHKFMNWKRALLTDSGGFQMVSLLHLADITEEGVTFQSPADGKPMLLTPEESIHIQNKIGADIIMALDDVVKTTITGPRIEEAMYRTIRWIDRCISAHNRPEEQSLFGIIQGGLDPSLRDICVKGLVSRNLPGYAIGGLAGGEDKDSFWRVVAQCTAALPEDKPRYVMGVGYPLDIVVCTALGADMYDCVYPTRTARFGTALTREGVLKLTHKAMSIDERPIDSSCMCMVCKNYTRAYIHRLVTTDAMGSQLLSYHNLSYMMRLSQDLHTSIVGGWFPEDFSVYRLKFCRATISSSSSKTFREIRQSNPVNHHIIHVCNQSVEGIVVEDKGSLMLAVDFPLKYSLGKAHPLGASTLDGGINFSIFSQHATSVILCISTTASYDTDQQLDGMIEVPLDPRKNRTGDIWHICIEGLPDSGVLYGYRVDGPSGWDQGHRFDNSTILLDPYAKLVSGRRYFGDIKQRLSKFLGTYDFRNLNFDWGTNYKLPNIPEKDLVIYEMNVRSFTYDESSGLDPEIRGSYLGAISKIPHLLELGVNAVELLPVFEFDELEFQRHPNPRDHMVNTWGYSTMNFFAPMSRYSSAGAGPLVASQEFKEMVRAFHSAGIEVILDIVFNHTNEADDRHPYTTSFRGIDNKVYYMMDLLNSAQLLNYSGCGNTLNCNHPVVMELILDSLRHWTEEYHVNGFRFDLASVLCRGTDGTPLDAPPLIKAIAKDPVLSKCKIIAEPWDCAGLYLVGKFPNWDRWAEWNGKYRDDIRRFLRGDPGMKGSFATRVSGSADLYQVNQRKPYHSINFVIAHDGFSLYDLVSYNSKHNDANGEGGRDGCNDNFSWNCGFEGETNDPKIRKLRVQQMKNFHVALMISQGTPMMLMGDEYGHTRYGNNNSYGHDTFINHFQWKELEAKRDTLFRFFSEMIKFRNKHPILRSSRFLDRKDVTWHEDNWDNPESKFLAFTLHDDISGGDIYVAFNVHDYVVNTAVPSPPKGKNWYRVVDTNLQSPNDFVAEGALFNESVYKMAPFSSIILKARP